MPCCPGRYPDSNSSPTRVFNNNNNNNTTKITTMASVSTMASLLNNRAQRRVAAFLTHHYYGLLEDVTRPDTALYTVFLSASLPLLLSYIFFHK